MKTALTKTKNFVYKHRVAIAVIATTAVFVALNKRHAKVLDAFLVEKGINPADYWTPEAY